MIEESNAFINPQSAIRNPQSFGAECLRDYIRLGNEDVSRVEVLSALSTFFERGECLREYMGKA